MDQTLAVTQTRSIKESVILPQSEAEFARDRKAAGTRIIEKKGQFWWETHRGFYQPVHWMTRMPAAQAVKPALLCWAYRATLSATDAAEANGVLPVNLLQDVSKFDVEKLPDMRRRGLRKSRKLATIVELTGPEILRSEGYEVLRSSRLRTGYTSLPTKQDYLASLGRTYTTRSVILAGIIQGKLGGYLEGYAVGPTAYIHSVILATEALPTQIGTALVVDFIQVCRQSGGIREIVYGQHSREDSSLVAYKEGMGFPVVRIPSKVYVNPILGSILRRRYPHFYYRLTGRE